MENPKNNSRRSFLKSLLAGSAVAAGAATAVRPAEAAQRRKGRRPDGEILYRETEAFKTYYNSLRS